MVMVLTEDTLSEVELELKDAYLRGYNDGVLDSMSVVKGWAKEAGMARNLAYLVRMVRALTSSEGRARVEE